MRSKDLSFKNETKKQNSKGQIVVEYVLLLIIGIGVATLIINLVVSRNPDEPGFLIEKWKNLLQFIAEDSADDLNSH